MEKPSNLLRKLGDRLFTDPNERAKFIDALTTPTSFPSCILWCREKPEIVPFPVEVPLPWQPLFVDRLKNAVKPGKHPLHERGAYYCLDFSSVFAAATLLAIPAPVYRVLDLCASPGGKGIFAWRALHPELLACNEVIGKRTAALISNLKRCQIRPAVVSSLDSQILAQHLPQTADVVIVDAPCSGQSLPVKGIKAPGCFHPVTINKNANRQKRILANAARLVAPQGYLAYMTCTYSPAENEQVCEWFLKRFPQFKPTIAPHLDRYQSHLASIPCYRMWPQSSLGAGAFTILFQNIEEGSGDRLPADFLKHPRLTYI